MVSSTRDYQFARHLGMAMEVSLSSREKVYEVMELLDVI